jgi:hypothetical protein
MPLWVALACCVAATLLIFGNTIPAIRAGEKLSQVEDDLETLKRRYDQAIHIAQLSGARGGPMAELDLQSLFVAIDQKGYTVAEFCAAHPSDELTDENRSQAPRGR